MSKETGADFFIRKEDLDDSVAHAIHVGQNVHSTRVVRLWQVHKHAGFLQELARLWWGSREKGGGHSDAV